MIRQTVKLIWNRRKANFLIVSEIFFAFLVLFGVLISVVYYADNWRRPLGYEWDKVWAIEVSGNRKTMLTPSGAEVSRQVLRAIGEFSEVETVGYMAISPFAADNWGTSASYRSRRARTSANAASDDIARALRLRLAEGRWFEPSDDTAACEPVTINSRFARELYGDDGALGKSINDSEQGKRTCVVGVLAEFREDGELAGPENYLIYRRSPAKLEQQGLGSLIVRVRPGTTAAFEEPLVRRIEAIAPEFTFKIESLARKRASMNRFRLAPLIAGGLIAFFLILMVALGMVGVVWQNVSRRRSEIGLRRALGGSRATIHRQLLLELVVIASVGLLAGVALVIQLPLLDIVDWLSPEVYTTGVLLSILVVYGVTLAAGLYPSLMAARLNPADALRQE